MSFTVATIAGLTKLGMNVYDQYQNKQNIKDDIKRREKSIADAKKQEASNAARTRNVLSSLMGKIGMSRDPMKTQQLGSIYQNTQRARDLQAVQSRQEISKLELGKQTVPTFNIMGLIAETATGALQGYQLEQALSSEADSEDFMKQMRFRFLEGFIDNFNKDDDNDGYDTEEEYNQENPFVFDDYGRRRDPVSNPNRWRQF